MLRNFFLALGGLVMAAAALMAGIFVFAILAVIGLGFAIWFRLRQKEILNSMEEMGSGHRPPPGTIEGDYEVIEEETVVIEQKDPQKDRELS